MMTAIQPADVTGRELTSAAGLALLHAAVWYAIGCGRCSDDVASMVGLLLSGVGLMIAAARRWRALAHATLVLACAHQLTIVGASASGTWTWTVISLLGITLPLLLFQLRVGWLDTAITGVCSALLHLLVFLMVECVNGGIEPTLRVWAIALGLLGVAGVTLSLRDLRRDQHRSAAALSLVTVVGTLFVLLPLVTQFLIWFVLPAALIMVHGLVFFRLDARRSWPGPLLAVLGVSLGALVLCIEAGGALSLFATLHGLAWVAFLLGGRMLATVGGMAVMVTLGLLGMAHPLWVGWDATPWSPSWRVWCVMAGLGAIQLFVLQRSAMRGRLTHLAPPWIASWLGSLCIVLVGAVGSTFLHRLIPWPPLLTLLWVGVATLGRWLVPECRPVVTAARIASLAALVKLVAWDWPRLGIVGRLILLLAVGAALLVAPLVRSSTRSEARET